MSAQTDQWTLLSLLLSTLIYSSPERFFSACCVNKSSRRRRRCQIAPLIDTVFWNRPVRFIHCCFVMIYVLLILLLSLVVIAALIVFCSLRSTRPRPKRVSVIVLGDIGRSPRMCNHAVSLADEGWSVDLIGYAESTPSQRVLQHPRIRIRPISLGWKLPKRPKILYILLAPLAAITRALNLAAVIIGSGRKGIILVQVCELIVRDEHIKIVWCLGLKISHCLLVWPRNHAFPLPSPPLDPPLPYLPPRLPQCPPPLAVRR